MNRFRRILPIAALCFAGVLSWAGCSVPNLEPQQCIDGREAARRFYSYHFAHDMKTSAENLAERKQFLTPSLYDTVAALPEGSFDHFTGTDQHPRAFKIGACEVNSETDVTLNVLLFWRDDTGSEQRSVKVNVVRSGDAWLVDRVSN